MSDSAVPEQNRSEQTEPVTVAQRAENMGLSTLTGLGNEAIALGLIAGHGHRRGQYEIIRNGEIVTLPPGEAVTYFQDLIQSASE